MINKYSTTILFFLLILSTFINNVFANNLNQEKKLTPLQIDANSIKHDDINLITTFEGNVVLVRGDLTIRGNMLILEQTEEGLSFGYILGKPAFFKSKRRVEGEWVEGEAKRLDYDERNSTFLLKGNAKLKRLKNGNIKDRVSGDELSYNSISEIYSARNVPGETRTRMTLMPIPSEPN